MSSKAETANQIKTLHEWLNYTRRAERQKPQRENLSGYEGLRPTILKACHILRVLAHETNHDNPEQTTKRSAANELEEACAESLLELAPAERRDKLKSRAAKFAEKQIKNLGELPVFAQAELRLRSLAYHCVEASSHQWRKSQRIPEWEILINTAKRELQRAVDEWEQIKRRSGH